jgi:hypothetical protein
MLNPHCVVRPPAATAVHIHPRPPPRRPQAVAAVPVVAAQPMVAAQPVAAAQPAAFAAAQAQAVAQQPAAFAAARAQAVVQQPAFAQPTVASQPVVASRPVVQSTPSYINTQVKQVRVRVRSCFLAASECMQLTMGGKPAGCSVNFADSRPSDAITRINPKPAQRNHLPQSNFQLGR